MHFGFTLAGEKTPPPSSLGSSGTMRSSARKRSYAAHSARLASCDSYLLRSLDTPMTWQAHAALGWHATHHVKLLYR